MKTLRLLTAAAAFALTAAAAPAPLPLDRLPKTGAVDERFQGYNIEMVEVTGGRFWAPYGGPKDEVYRQRPPIDLTDPKLVALARNLGPSLLRVSGTWANNTYLLAEGETLTAPPAGFSQILTRDQWRKVIAFSKAVDAPIVTSFAASGGTRDADGMWKTDQAQRMAELTKSAGGSFYAAEFFNEPNIPGATAGMPPAYDVPNYAADFRIFRDWARKTLPGMKILGAGGVSEAAAEAAQHAPHYRGTAAAPPPRTQPAAQARRARRARAKPPTRAAAAPPARSCERDALRQRPACAPTAAAAAARGSRANESAACPAAGRSRRGAVAH